MMHIFRIQEKPRVFTSQHYFCQCFRVITSKFRQRGWNQGGNIMWLSVATTTCDCHSLRDEVEDAPRHTIDLTTPFVEHSSSKSPLTHIQYMHCLDSDFCWKNTPFRVKWEFTNWIPEYFYAFLNWITELSVSFLPAVYLGVTNLSVYQVRMTSLCAQWQPHRHASAYRVAIESLLSEYTYSSTVCSNLRCSFHCFVYNHYSTCPNHTGCYRC